MVLSFIIIHTLLSLPTTLSSFAIVPQHAAHCRDTRLGPGISWAKGRHAIVIIAATVRADVDADADAGTVVVVNIIPSAIPPPVVVVTHGSAPQSSTS